MYQILSEGTPPKKCPSCKAKKSFQRTHVNETVKLKVGVLTMSAPVLQCSKCEQYLGTAQSMIMENCANVWLAEGKKHQGSIH